MIDQNEFAHNGVAYVAESSPSVGSVCFGCAFFDYGCFSPVVDSYSCRSSVRTDKRDIIWKRKLGAHE